jgi:hypothetical protein
MYENDKKVALVNKYIKCKEERMFAITKLAWRIYLLSAPSSMASRLPLGDSVRATGLVIPVRPSAWPRLRKYVPWLLHTCTTVALLKT